jgi:hypothetical protein
VVGKPKGKKVSKKLPKIPDAPVAGSQKRSPPAASVMQKNDVHFDSTPTMIHAVFTPQTTQQYPGAVASGADEHASAVLEADQVFINNEDIWEAEETDLVDTIPRSPRRTLAEFEPEGFGLKMQYLKRATSYVDEPPQGSVELEVSGINDKASHTEEQSTAGLFSHIGTGSVVSGGQHAADQADQEIGESYDQNKSG